MSLSSMEVFNIKPYTKPRIRRLSSGEFHVDSRCVVGDCCAEQYVNYVLFLEASSGFFRFESH